MNTGKKSLFKLFFGLSVSIICLFFALKGINFSSLLKTFTTVRLHFVLLFLLIILITIILRSALYYRFLSIKKKVSLFSIFEGLIIGYMFNSIFPFRTGDIVKAYIIGKMNNVSKTYTFTITIIERLFDMLNLLLFFIVLLLTFNVDNKFKNIAQILALFIALAIIVIIFTIKYMSIILGLTEKFRSFINPAVIDNIKNKLMIIHDGLKILCDYRDILFIEVLFLFIWGGYILVSYVTGLSIGLNMSFTFILLLLITLSFGSAIAVSPGGLGIHQYACVLVFSYFHLSRETALTFSLIQNSIFVVTPIVLGWIFLVHTNLSLSKITENISQNEDNNKTPINKSQ